MSFLVKLFAIPSVLFVLFVCVAESQRAGATSATKETEPTAKPEIAKSPIVVQPTIQKKELTKYEIEKYIDQYILDASFTSHYRQKPPFNCHFPMDTYVKRYEDRENLKIQNVIDNYWVATCEQKYITSTSKDKYITYCFVVENNSVHPVEWFYGKIERAEIESNRNNHLTTVQILRKKMAQVGP